MTAVPRTPSDPSDPSDPPGAPRRGRRPGWPAWAGGAAVVGGAAYLFTHDPNVAGAYPPCILLSLTGWYCPACGGTRAAYDLLHGDVAGAFARNPLVPLLVVLAALWLLRRALGAGRPSPGTGPSSPRRWPNWVPVALGLAFLAFGVLRNLPGWEWLSPA